MCYSNHVFVCYCLMLPHSYTLTLTLTLTLTRTTHRNYHPNYARKASNYHDQRFSSPTVCVGMVLTNPILNSSPNLISNANPNPNPNPNPKSNPNPNRRYSLNRLQCMPLVTYTPVRCIWASLAAMFRCHTDPNPYANPNTNLNTNPNPNPNPNPIPILITS